MLNHITVMGRLTRDPELRRTGSGVAVTSFTIACDRDFGNNGEKETDFVEIVCWRNTAEFVSKYFSKGRMAVVFGRLQIRSWNDKDGNKRKTAEIVADNVYFGDSKSNTQSQSSGYVGFVKAEKVPNTYATPSGGSNDFAMLDDSDAMLPF